MFQQVLTHITEHWVEWFFMAIAAFCGWGYKILAQRQKEQETKNDALCEGVQALLRNSIVNTYNRSLDRGYCPIYEKENIERVYSAYHLLHGNDIATGLYNKVLAMPTEKVTDDA